MNLNNIAVNQVITLVNEWSYVFAWNCVVTKENQIICCIGTLLLFIPKIYYNLYLNSPVIHTRTLISFVPQLSRDFSNGLFSFPAREQKIEKSRLFKTYLDAVSR
jgi:hypothetical protein